MDSDQESDESGLFFDEEDDSDNENQSEIELDEAEEENNTAISLNEVRGHATINFTKSINPIDVFNQFFTKDIIDLIVAQTNIYGEQMILANNSISNWQEVTENAIHSFLGLLIIMSLHRLPLMRDYWSRNKYRTTVCVHEIQKDRDVSGHLVSHGIWEEHLVTRFIRILSTYKQYSFIDIGANLGKYTMYAASLGCSNIISIECFRPNIERIRR
ncbi:unnamed protein product [Rotaria socialis]|uniref:PiggyBac transposable element-derived protein domain-containing protein n=1 Tax=Rotaria socialis TaxID=392032 RepID=A0A820YZX6_9BILA|nr:unnamed protein product [Rotaria socialis]CAF4709546.1 unnamed protein product [Rotaria socialis]